MHTCFYCEETFKQSHLRPYGPNGALICYQCGQATPERIRQTEDAMAAILSASEAMSPQGVAVIDADGFHPMDISKMIKPGSVTVLRVEDDE